MARNPGALQTRHDPAIPIFNNGRLDSQEDDRRIRSIHRPDRVIDGVDQCLLRVHEMVRGQHHNRRGFVVMADPQQRQEDTGAVPRFSGWTITL